MKINGNISYGRADCGEECNWSCLLSVCFMQNTEQRVKRRYSIKGRADGKIQEQI